MHKHPHRFPAFSGAFPRESRLLRKIMSPGGSGSRQENADLLEQRVSRGRKFHSVEDAGAEMKSDARNCVEKLGKTRVGWLKWVNHFCSTELALKANIKTRSEDYADRMLKQSGLYVNVVAGSIFRRGKRALMLARRSQLQKQFLDDMQQYYREQEESLQQDENLYGRLGSAFAKQRVSVNVGSPKRRQAILNAIGSLTAEIDAEAGKREAAVQDKLEDFRMQAKDEQHLKQVLLQMNVLETTTQLDDLLERNARGDKALYTLIKNHPALLGAEQADLRNELLATVNSLRRRGRWYNLWLAKGSSGWYRAFLEGKKQPISEDETFKVLQDELFDRRIRVKIPGMKTGDLDVEKKDVRRGIYFLHDPVTKSPMILDPKDREITYVDAKNQVKHFSFHDVPNSITLV